MIVGQQLSGYINVSRSHDWAFIVQFNVMMQHTGHMRGACVADQCKNIFLSQHTDTMEASEGVKISGDNDSDNDDNSDNSDTTTATTTMATTATTTVTCRMGGESKFTRRHLPNEWQCPTHPDNHCQQHQVNYLTDPCCGHHLTSASLR
jgi:hypothetical protein